MNRVYKILKGIFFIQVTIIWLHQNAHAQISLYEFCFDNGSALPCVNNLTTGTASFGIYWATYPNEYVMGANEVCNIAPPSVARVGYNWIIGAAARFTSSSTLYGDMHFSVCLRSDLYSGTGSPYGIGNFIIKASNDLSNWYTIHPSFEPSFGYNKFEGDLPAQLDNKSQIWIEISKIDNPTNQFLDLRVDNGILKGHQYNTFKFNSIDNNWHNSQNWTLGIVPDSTQIVNLFPNKKIEIFPGNTANARSILLESCDTIIVNNQANLHVKKYIRISNDGKFINHGKTILEDNNKGIIITNRGSLSNYDSLLINTPSLGVEIKCGNIYNNGVLKIMNSNEQAIKFNKDTCTSLSQIHNDTLGQIIIQNPKKYGISISDTLVNHGVISIIETDSITVLDTTASLFIDSTGTFLNSNQLTIDGSDQHGLFNLGTINNSMEGSIEVLNFKDIGINNYNVINNYGLIHVLENINIAAQKGFFNSGPLTTFTGSDIIIEKL